MVKSSAATTGVVSHTSLAVGTAFHVARAVLISPWKAAEEPPSIVRWIGKADVGQCFSSGCEPTVSARCP